jgi:hypothetical protein
MNYRSTVRFSALFFTASFCAETRSSRTVSGSAIYEVSSESSQD